MHSPSDSSLYESGQKSLGFEDAVAENGSIVEWRCDSQTTFAKSMEQGAADIQGYIFLASASVDSNSSDAIVISDVNKELGNTISLDEAER